LQEVPTGQDAAREITREAWSHGNTLVGSGASQTPGPDTATATDSVGDVQLRRPEHPGRVAVVGIGLLVAVNLAVVAARSQDTSTASQRRPESIRAVYPAENTQIRPQEEIRVYLRDNRLGILTIGGVRIPEDQYTGNRGLGEVFFRPGAGKEFRELPEGPLEATVEYWPATQTEEEARADRAVFSYTWQFTVG
jgi:hypothetical protein